MRTYVIWINNWFSSMMCNIKDIKRLIPGIKIIGTSISENCTYKHEVDEFYIEPFKVDLDTYLDWALKFCKEHSINCILPKNYINTLSKNKETFKNIGIDILCEDYSTRRIFDSKDNVYKILDKLGYNKIPLYSIVDNVDDFMSRYVTFKNMGYKVCFKYDHDEGAGSFREINDSSDLNIESLDNKIENKISYLDAKEILRNYYSGKPIMIMPKLSSPEVSVDCYDSPELGFIAIPRYKDGNRLKHIELNKELIEDCKYIQSIFKFKYAFNVQYRWDNMNNSKLLEVNPRMSGGIHISSMSGFCIPAQVIADKLGIKLNQTKDSIKECTVTQFEHPVIV